MTSAAARPYQTFTGTVTRDDARETGCFESAPDFLRRRIAIPPLMLAWRAGRFSFPDLSRETSKGLPGLLADSARQIRLVFPNPTVFYRLPTLHTA